VTARVPLLAAALVLGLAMATNAADASVLTVSDTLAEAPSVPALARDAAREPAPVANAPLAGAPRAGWLSRRNLALGAATVGALAIAFHNDSWIAEEAAESRSPGEHRLARAAEPLGSVAIVFPTLAAAWIGAHVLGRTDEAAGVGRVAVDVAAAGAVTLALKEVVGRARPIETGLDSDVLRPFSGRASFPSGHAAVSFALATAVRDEMGARWTSWVLLPAAGLVGWSRVHDREHWTSDVIAGAALGAWTAHLTDRAQREGRLPIRLGFMPVGGAPGVGISLGR
jgi:membrane-associated phospholipid phosphatase